MKKWHKSKKSRSKTIENSEAIKNRPFKKYEIDLDKGLECPWGTPTPSRGGTGLGGKIVYKNNRPQSVGSCRNYNDENRNIARVYSEKLNQNKSKVILSERANSLKP